jgi:hypothetical protein
MSASLQTPFGIHAEAYRIAREAYEAHRQRCRPESADSPLQYAYESAYQPLVDAMSDASTKAVQTPAASFSEIAEKLRIFDREDMQDDTNAKEMIGCILADALRLAGGAA